jgi:hypothetical protein
MSAHRRRYRRIASVLERHGFGLATGLIGAGAGVVTALGGYLRWTARRRRRPRPPHPLRKAHS